MFRHMCERHDEFIAMKGDQCPKGHFYRGHIHVWEDQKYRAFKRVRHVKGFPGIVSERIEHVRGGAIRNLPHFEESGSDGYEHRGFALEFDSISAKMFQQNTIDFLHDEKEIGRVMRYFRQYYG
jgi:hypothetical protein